MQVSAVIFGFLNIARALVPVRIALTLATAPAVDKYIIKVTVTLPPPHPTLTHPLVPPLSMHQAQEKKMRRMQALNSPPAVCPNV